MTVNRVFEGLTVVAVGVILLLNTTGYLPWSVWFHVLTLWPLLLVAGGLEIIGKGMDAVWLRVLSSVIVLGGLLVGAFALPAMTDAPGWGRHMTGSGTPFEIEVPLERGVREGEARIEGAVGAYTVSAGDELVSVRGRSPFGSPRVDTSVEAGRATVDVRGPEGSGIWMPGMRSGTRMDVTLAETVVWDLSLDSGVVDVDADLSGLRLGSLTVDAGVSQVTVRLGDVPRGEDEVPVHVKGGVANFVLRVPRDAGVRVDADAGLSNIDVARDIPRVAGERRWQNDAFAESGGYRIRVETGVSNVRIQTY